MRTVLSLLFVLVFSFQGIGCVSLSRGEQATLRELNSYGISSTEVKEKHPGAAGALNILPGFGNFYLAAGTEESDQWLFGFLNLLTWPLSILWGIPEAAIDANAINKRETIYYYTYDKQGIRELEQIRSEQGAVTRRRN